MANKLVATVDEPISRVTRSSVKRKCSSIDDTKIVKIAASSEKTTTNSPIKTELKGRLNVVTCMITQLNKSCKGSP